MNTQNISRLPMLLLAASLAITACSPKPESANEIATQQLIEATQKADEAAARAEAAQKALEQAEADKRAAEVKAAADADAAADKLAAAKARQRAAARAAPVRAEAPKPVCIDCGTVTAITPVQVKGEGTGMGAVAGAIAGAVIGHQFGRGQGNTAAKVAGAAAGGYAGNAAEKSIRGSTVYDVSVRMDAGGSRTVRVTDATTLSDGERVRVSGSNIERL